MKVFGSIIFLLVISFGNCLGQHYDKKDDYLLHKKRIAELQKHKPSLGRDTLIQLELDTLIKCHKETDFELFGNKQYNSQFKYWKNLAYHSKWKKGIALFHSAYGIFITDSNASVEGLQNLLIAQNEFEKLNDKPNQVKNLIHLTVIFTYHTDTLSPLPYFEKAISMAKQLKDTSLMVHVYNYKGDYHIIRKEFEKAFYYYNEIDKLKKPERNKSLKSWTNDLYLGVCYLNLNQERKGLSLIDSTFKTLPVDILYHRYLHITIRSEIIKFFISKKQPLKAEKYANQIANLNSLSNNFQFQDLDVLFEIRYIINKQKGNYKEALKNFEALIDFRNRMQKGEINNRIEGIKSQLAFRSQTEKLQKLENEKLRAENERQRQFKWFLIAICIIGLILTIYVFRTNQKLKINNIELLYKNKEVSEAMLKGQTIERKRVASDLHDNLGSTMSSIRWAFQAIDRTKWSDNEKEIFTNVQTMFDKAYDDIRLLSHNLLPEEFERLGLTSTLQNFIRKINKNTTIRFDLKVEQEFGRVDKKIEFELYSICLELVNNIMKHSKASEAVIELSRTKNQIKLVVSDNGIGIFKNESDGKGMKNVQARVESLNGTWRLQNTENEGFMNEISIPV